MAVEAAVMVAAAAAAAIKEKRKTYVETFSDMCHLGYFIVEYDT